MTGLMELFVSAFISSTIAPGGSEAVLAYMVSGKAYRMDSLLAAATVGNTLGAMTTWYLGILASRKFPIPAQLPPNKQKALAVVKTRGQWVLFFSWLPVVGDVLCFAAGWLNLPFLPGFLIIMLGKFCRYAAIALVFV
jgi:membrane protein YqaA with SNARE-associated domain